MFFLVTYYVSCFSNLLFFIDRGLLVVGNGKGVITWCNYMEGGVNMCIYSRIYTVNTPKMNTYPCRGTPPLVGGGYNARKCVLCTLIYSTIGLVFLS